MIRHCAIIPARSGSKSIKDKNLLRLNNKSLIKLAVDVAFESKIFSKIVLSTDYQMFKTGLDGYKPNHLSKWIYLNRPQELATDETLMIDVVKHAIANAGISENYIWILQPTSPFRTVEEMKFIQKKIESGEFKSCVSWKPLKETIDRSATWKNGKAHRIMQNNFKNKQDLQKQLYRSGNYYVIDINEILNYKGPSDKFSWMVEPSFPYVMGGCDPDKMELKDFLKSRMLGLNIDDTQDYNEAKDYVRRGDVII